MSITVSFLFLCLVSAHYTASLLRRYLASLPGRILVLFDHVRCSLQSTTSPGRASWGCRRYVMLTLGASPSEAKTNEDCRLVGLSHLTCPVDNLQRHCLLTVATLRYPTAYFQLARPLFTMAKRDRNPGLILSCRASDGSYPRPVLHRSYATTSLPPLSLPLLQYSIYPLSLLFAHFSLGSWKSFHLSCGPPSEKR
ncbi:hypothetical protein F4818DRAFT_406213 [Hypoxylon cercidicola]|nr:hypothetical protein F4818DRAFT_406213 [Hypoxylon cercidicola]